MISRRGLFRLLGGLAVSPVLKPLAALIPDNGISEGRIPWWAGGWWRNRSVDRTLEVYYSEQLLETLRTNTPLLASIQQNPLPLRSGKTIQFFTFSNPKESWKPHDCT